MRRMSVCPWRGETSRHLPKQKVNRLSLKLKIKKYNKAQLKQMEINPQIIS